MYNLVYSAFGPFWLFSVPTHWSFKTGVNIGRHFFEIFFFFCNKPLTLLCSLQRALQQESPEKGCPLIKLYPRRPSGAQSADSESAEERCSHWLQSPASLLTFHPGYTQRGDWLVYYRLCAASTTDLLWSGWTLLLIVIPLSDSFSDRVFYEACGCAACDSRETHCVHV